MSQFPGYKAVCQSTCLSPNIPEKCHGAVTSTLQNQVQQELGGHVGGLVFQCKHQSLVVLIGLLFPLGAIKRPELLS